MRTTNTIQELLKYPPSRQLLAIPGHRRWLWWYVGRASVRIPLSECRAAPGSDRLTLTVLDDGFPLIVPVGWVDLDGDEVSIPTGLDGPGCLLVLDPRPAQSTPRPRPPSSHSMAGVRRPPQILRLHSRVAAGGAALLRGCRVDVAAELVEAPSTSGYRNLR